MARLRKEVVEEKAKNPARSKVTRAKAIRLQCIECMGYQAALVKSCPDEGCPLWSYRMGNFENTPTPIRNK